MKQKKHTFSQTNPTVDFVAQEKKWLDWWYSSGVVEKYLHRNDDANERFSFIDGPITANNPMGVHHAWGRTFKDLWQRYHTMKGEAGRYQNGFDCQGLWVEVEVEKELGIKNKQDIEKLVPGDTQASIAKFVELCRQRVLKFSEIQTNQSKRLGYFMNWDNSYFTMSDENNYMIWHFLKVCHEKGWIYKGRDSVPWCPRCETAISQHEMLTEDYKELTHETVFVKLPVVTEGWEDHVLLIWTTTPWTVPANVAVGVNIKCTYAQWRDEATGELYLFLAKDEEGNDATRPDKKGKPMPVAEWILKDSGKTLVPTGKTYLGKELLGLRYTAPFDFLPRVQKAQSENPEKFHVVVDASEIVTSFEGTGLLHLATGAGQEDFKIGKKEGLPVIAVIGDNADYLDGMEEFSGKNAKKHPDLIIDYLKQKENGLYLLKSMGYTHRYPACWRCKAELVWKVADEWYIAMDIEDPTDTKQRTLRQQMKDVASEITWMPDFGLERELDWLSNMHDWLISKPNRYWGLALPIYECATCGNFEVLGGRDELKKRAVSGWETFDGHTPHKPWVDTVTIKCSHCDAEVHRLNDVGNVWLDAGIVPYSTLVDPKTGKVSYTTDKSYWEKWFPADFITESFPGQFKNWFYSLIAMSTVLERKPSFRRVLGFGTLLGEDGRPMHKSWGNAIEFNEGADTIGADVMRWMYCSHDPSQNILFGYKKADETRRRFHILLWNVYNFFITYAVVDGWTPTGTISTHVLDRWILSRLHQTIKLVSERLDAYDVYKASQSIESFVSDLSLWYVRRSRERIGPTARDSSGKDACYSTLYTVLVTISQLLAPFTPFLSEDMYKNLTGEESVHLSDWSVYQESHIDSKLEDEMMHARAVVEMAHAKRKEVGVKVRQPLASLTTVYPASFSKDVLSLIQDEVNVKDVKNTAGEEKQAVFDLTITDTLKEEGEVREVIRQIQQLRKQQGCSMEASIVLTLPEHYKKYSKDSLEEIRRSTIASAIAWGTSLAVSTE